MAATVLPLLRNQKTENMKNQENIQKADGRKTTALIKKMMKERFNIKISVQSESYSGGSSLNVKYNLGPDDKVIESVLKNLQYGNFNGMEDIYEMNDEKTGIVYDGYQLDDFKFVFVRQEMSKEFKYKMAEAIDSKIKFENLELTADLHTYQPNSSFRSYNDMMFQQLGQTNFATQNEDEIVFVDAKYEDTPQEYNRIVLYYTIGGVIYNTSSLKPIQQQIEEVKKDIASAKNGIADEVEKMVNLFAKIDIEQTGKISESLKEAAAVQGVDLVKFELRPGVSIVNYSEKAFAIIGEGTRAIKDQLFQLGGKFNRNLKCGAGFIFSNKRYTDVYNAININSEGAEPTEKKEVIQPESKAESIVPKTIMIHEFEPSDKFLLIFIYKSSGDCGGITDQLHKEQQGIFIPNEEGNYSYNDLKEQLDRVFVIEHRGPEYYALKPLIQRTDLIGPMSGGNLAYSCDSRCRRVYHIHDRFETPTQYEQLSR